MEKRLAVIEISNQEVRLLIGEVINDKPVIYHRAERSISGLISRGEIVDHTTLTQIIASLTNIPDKANNKTYRVTDATVILPPSGLTVYQGDKTTNIVSATSIIETIDIQNVISLVQKEPIPGGNQIVDIVPDMFVIEGGRKSIEPPLGQKSNSLTLKSKIYTLPTHIIEQYRRVVEAAGVHAKRLFISPYGIIELAKQSREYPADYLLVDMGAQLSSISLVGNQSLFSTITFTLGGDDLVNHVKNELAISYDDAKEIIELYGINERVLTYRPTVATTNTDGYETNYSPEDLNNVIIDFFVNHYFKQLDVVISNIIQDYKQENLRNLPIIFTGGFSKLHGFDKLAKEKFVNNQSIHYLEPDVIGARNPSYSALVGALIASSKYKGSLSDQKARVAQVERLENKQE